MNKPVEISKDGSPWVVVDVAKKIKIIQEKEPSNLAMERDGIDIVVESTGVFESHEKSQPIFWPVRREWLLPRRQKTK